MGYEGTVAVTVEDSYKEIMFMVANGNWTDRVFMVDGSGERK